MSEGHVRVIQAVAETASHVWMMQLSYAGGAEEGVGSVWSLPLTSVIGVVPTLVFGTREALTTMWASPSGAVWVASAKGEVSTTARVPGASDAKEGELVWTSMTLPPVKSTGIPPNASALWGIDDTHVYVGTYLGHIYFFDGTKWEQVVFGTQPGAYIRAFAGTANDVYACGTEGMLLHFDGKTWSTLDVGLRAQDETLVSMHMLSSREVVIATSAGRLLQGNTRGWREVLSSGLSFVGMVTIGERMLFATGEGVAERFGDEVRIVKSNFQTAAAWQGSTRAFFIEPSQPQPAYIEHNPTAATPWMRCKH